MLVPLLPPGGNVDVSDGCYYERRGWQEVVSGRLGEACRQRARAVVVNDVVGDNVTSPK